jgi:UDP-2-acetamido-2,6-beta-L-arabino-hexul-4-ose reductase
MKVGITGVEGFIGRHLKNYLSLQKDIELVSFEKSWFEQPQQLQHFVQQCDTIVHLAAMNRHSDAQVIYRTNIELVGQLIAACTVVSATPHILFSSSTQEYKDNEYGQSKKIGRTNLETWGVATGAKVTGMVIPNVFGPFGKPFYNSVIATFCHQVAVGEQPQIQVDGTLQLVYINELITDIYQFMIEGTEGTVEVAHRHEIKVSEMLDILLEFKVLYIDNGTVPAINTPFRLALFNTFRCYIPPVHYPVLFKLNPDDRGTFVEIIRTNSAGQFSYSTTKPGITRGNHFHTRKAERFAVISGKARIDLRKIDSQEVISYTIDGTSPAFVDMPIWYTHNITNIGEEELLTLFWINEPYNPDDPDTYFVNV